MDTSKNPSLVSDAIAVGATGHLSRPKYRPDINGLRAVAVLAVVIFHAFPIALPGGFVGVDIFFVISGFLISTIILASLDNNTFSMAEFYARRIKRIFPALFLVLAACFVYGWFNLLASDYTQLGKHVAASAGFVLNLALWHESGYFDSTALTKPLLHLWSLGIEEQFYIVWPLLLWIGWKRNFNLLTLILTVALISFLLNIKHVRLDSVGAFYSPQTRFWELLIGSTVAWIKLNRPRALSKLGRLLDRAFDRIVFAQPVAKEGALLANAQSFAGAALITTAVLLTNSDKAFPGWWALLPTFGAALLISAGQHAWVNRVILSNRVLVWVGLISFPLYLWHWPLLAFVHIIYGAYMPTDIRFGCVAIAIGLAWLTYRCVENPIRGDGQTAIKVTVLVALMAGIGYAGFDTYTRDGLQFRSVVNNQNIFVSKLSKIVSVYTFYDSFREWRLGTCYAPAQGMTFEQKLNTCVEKKNPLIFMFGDSYTAMLYPGLSVLQKNGGVRFGIAQFTNSNGPPFFDETKRSGDWKANNRTLSDLNGEKIKAIAETKPAVVLMSWMWDGMNSVRDKAQLIAALQVTVTKIHGASPASKVLVIGPVPQWEGIMKDNIVAYARSHDGKLPPAYSDYRLSVDQKNEDAFLAAELPKIGIDYVSALGALCKTTGCLTRTANDPNDLTTVDWGHLTRAGSIFLINSIKGRIFAELK